MCVQLPRHDCIQALKQKVTDLSDQLEQQRIDFQFRQTRLEEYVRRHEAGDRITWARLLSEKALSGTDTFRTSKTPRVPVQRVFQSQSEPAKRWFFSQRNMNDMFAGQVKVPKMIFDPRGKSPHVQLLNDNTTMTAADEDSGGVALGSVMLSGKGVYYWEVRSHI